MLTVGFFLDAALTTPIISAWQIVQALAEPPASRAIWFGLADERRWVSRAGGGAIVLQITGPAAADIALAKSLGELAAATPGAPLPIGSRVDGGPAGARAIWLGIHDSTGAPGTRAFTIAANDIEEWVST